MKKVFRIILYVILLALLCAGIFGAVKLGSYIQSSWTEFTEWFKGLNPFGGFYSPAALPDRIE